jgi:EF hand domain-containing protein
MQGFLERRIAVLPRLRLRIAALALAGLAAAAAPVHAKSLTPQAFIEQWDADHDGTLSLDEVKKAASARFDELDRDHDGTLDRRELGATMTPQEFKRADTDADRTLDKQEYLAVVEKRFKAADKDGDGTLDKKELSSLAGRILLRLFGPTQAPLF